MRLVVVAGLVVVGAFLGVLVAPAWSDRRERSAAWRAQARSAPDRRLLVGGRATSTLLVGIVILFVATIMLLVPRMSEASRVAGAAGVVIGVGVVALGEVARHRLLAEIDTTLGPD